MPLNIQITGTSTAEITELINALQAKASLVDADKIVIIDSEDSNVLKQSTWTTVKNFLKSYLDGIYKPKNAFDLDTKREMQVLPRASFYDFLAVGIDLPANTGDGIPSNYDDDQGNWQILQPNFAPNGWNAIESSYDQLKGGWDVTFITRIRTKYSDNELTRTNLGLFSATANSNILPANSVCIRFDPNWTGYSNWTFSTTNGVGGESNFDSGININYNEIYDLKIRLTSTAVYFYINNVLLHTEETIIPDPTVYLGYGIYQVTRDGGGQALLWGRIAIIY
jgi:hypothetical protein